MTAPRLPWLERYKSLSAHVAHVWAAVKNESRKNTEAENNTGALSVLCSQEDDLRLQVIEMFSIGG